jgi:hypothetical protein
MKLRITRARVIKAFKCFDEIAHGTSSSRIEGASP